MKNGLKSPIVKFVKWMVILGVIGVMGGAFLPFIGWEFLGGSDYICFFAFMEEVEAFVCVVIMIVAFVISIVTGIRVNTSMKMGTLIWMLIAAIVGEIGFRCYVAEARKHFIFRFGVGRVVMEGAYIVLIVAAFIALGVCIYYNNSSMHRKRGIVSMGYSCCPKCGNTVLKDTKYCDSCGFSLVTLVCPSCGARREPDAQFCGECGKRLPVLNMRENENRTMEQRIERIMNAFEQRIWDGLLIVLTLMSLFAMLTVVFSLFFPYANTYNYLQDYLLGEGEAVHRLIHTFGYEGCDSLKTYLIIMGIAVVLFHVALVWFGKCTDWKASITMVIVSVVGRFFLGMYKKGLLTYLQDEFGWVKEAMGVKVLEVAYIVLIICAVIALGMDIYNGYISRKEKIGIAD